MIARVFTRNKEVRRVSEGPRCFRFIKKSLPDVCHKLSKKKNRLIISQRTSRFVLPFPLFIDFFLRF